MRRKFIIILLFIIVLSVVLLSVQFIGLRIGREAEKSARCGVESIKLFSFSNDDDLKPWEDKIFKGKVGYKIEKDGDNSFIRAHSDNSASALYYKVNLDARNRRPIISWKWIVDKFPAKSMPEGLETADEHDFAGRIYVVFPAVFILNSKVLEYIWAEKLPVGSTGTSPYSKNIKLLVLESGTAKGKEFVSEKRDVVADYLKAFGTIPERNIGAIAVMTNSEHTKSSADAGYDDIEVGYKI